jgi:hypothetical protein
MQNKTLFVPLTHKIHKMKKIIFALLLLLNVVAVAQKPTNVLIEMGYGGLYQGVNNPVRIVAQQNEPITIKDVSATFQMYDAEYDDKNAPRPIKITGDSGYFNIQPDSVGLIEISIKTKYGIETKNVYVKPLRISGSFGNRRGGFFSVAEFKAKYGILAIVECCGFDAKCQVIGFEILRLPKNGNRVRTLNKGGGLDENGMKVINQAQSEDIYIFQKIQYRCPGDYTPREMEMMVFEIKE